MLFLISDNAITGTTTQTEGLPSGFVAVEGPDAPVEQLFWDGEAIQFKPAPPDEQAVWDNETNEWKMSVSVLQPEIPTEEYTPNSPNWDSLIASLQHTSEWGRAYAASERTLKANTAFTTLMTVLGSLRQVETLQFALLRLRESMTEIPELGDFSEDEISSVNQKLATSGFEFQLSVDGIN